MPETIHSDRWISLQVVFDYLGVKRHTVMRWIAQRGMPASKVGKLWRSKLPILKNGLKRVEHSMNGRVSNERI